MTLKKKLPKIDESLPVLKKYFFETTTENEEISANCNQ